MEVASGVLEYTHLAPDALLPYCAHTGRSIPEDQLAQGVGALVQPVLEPLQAAMQQLQPGTSYGTNGKLPLVDRLATIFKTIDKPAVAADILVRAWPALNVAFTKAGNDKHAIERLCRALRYGLKASGKSCSNMLPILLEALPARFQQVSVLLPGRPCTLLKVYTACFLLCCFIPFNLGFISVL